MRQIPLSNIPNQNFSFQADDNIYDITLQDVNNIMAATVSINSVLTISGQRIVAGFPIIPYRYLTNGNFIITSENDDIPYWPQFGITQFFYYVSQAEIAAARAGT
jgi:hypothetical protein